MGFKQVNFFRIYNRWGKLLFEMKSDRPGWDGSSKDLDQSTQAVVWMIEAIDMDGVLHKAQGSTVLVR
jgi:gliding motility-associated-like protein